MPHLVKFHFPNLSRDYRLRQTFAKGTNPAIDQDMIDPQNLSHHPERTLRHRIQQDAQRLLRRNFLVRACISLPKVASTLFATVPLPASYHAILDRMLRSTSLAFRHLPSLHQNHENILLLIYIFINTLENCLF
jgi:hypothetical protein